MMARQLPRALGPDYQILNPRHPVLDRPYIPSPQAWSMAPLSLRQVVALVLVSSSLSVASTVTLMRFVPELAAMPLPEPEIQLKSHAVPRQLVCEAGTDWQDVEDLSTSFSTRRDGTVLVVLTTWVAYGYVENRPEAKAFLYVNAYVDDQLADPREVCISYSSESAGMGQTVLLHAEGVEAGTHTLRFQWRNLGAAVALLRNPVIEIMAIPEKNLI